MNTNEFQAKTSEIINRLEPSQAAMWEYLLVDASSRLREALSRTVLLVGSEEITLADGKIEGDDGTSGWIVVITSSRLIRATFEPDGQGTVVAEAVSLESVRRVRVESVLAGKLEDAEWPARARLALEIDREVAGVSEVIVPSNGLAEKHSASVVASLAQRLPLS